MPSSTVENYLKRIYLEQQAGPDGDIVSMKSLAGAMGVTAGTATSMAKSLSDSRLVAYEPYGGVKLTARGRTLALRVLRRHRLIECLLVDALGLVHLLVTSGAGPCRRDESAHRSATRLI